MNTHKYQSYLIALGVLAIIWTLGSWYWYVCPIKGFCRAPHMPVAAAPKAPASQEDCSKYLQGQIKIDLQNDPAQVEKLQRFLDKNQGENLTVTGTYTPADEAAVKRFQVKYRHDVLDPWGYPNPTGYIYKTTREKINELYCAGSDRY